jgi:predicted RNase H-like HicB family nuclease
MSMADIDYGNNSKFLKEDPVCEQGDNADPYRVEILTIQEEEGGFSTIALNLPGAGSCGDTKDESVANAKEAIKAVLEVHTKAGDMIPWVEVTADKITRGEREVIWIHV